MATQNDISRISEINIFSWRSNFRNILSDVFLFSKLSVLKNIKGYERAFNEKKHEIYVFEQNSIIKAFSAISPCKDDEINNAFELYSIYVDPLMERQGIGTILLEHCERKAIENGYSENIIWVFEDNKKARAFYEKNGYKSDECNKVDSLQAVEIRYRKSLINFG